MEHKEQQTKISFSKKAALLGLISYVALAAMITAVFIFG